MDGSHELDLYSDGDLFDLNLVRIHLQVTTLSDIVDGLGKQITHEVYDGMKLTDSYSTLKWPRQPGLTRTQRNVHDLHWLKPSSPLDKQQQCKT
jgi:hypothetical protein